MSHQAQNSGTVACPSPPKRTLKKNPPNVLRELWVNGGGLASWTAREPADLAAHAGAAIYRGWSMIRKSVQRFSEKIMLNQKPKARWRFNPISSRFGRANERGRKDDRSSAPAAGQATAFSLSISRTLSVSSLLRIASSTSTRARFASRASASAC